MTSAAGAPRGMIGVIGGMGAIATVDFLHKLVVATPATIDQEHVPLLVRFCPEVPDRIAALRGVGPSPEPALVAAAQALEAGGAGCLAMPCNTAHVWHDPIERAVRIPVLHIVDTALDAVAPADREAVGLIGTEGTLASGIYQRRSRGIRWIEPEADVMRMAVVPGIVAVKRNEIPRAADLLGSAVASLARRGARVVVMACTEIPVALAGRLFPVPLIDPTDALARACVRWSTAARAMIDHQSKGEGP